MKPWIERQLEPALRRSGAPTVVLDPDGLLGKELVDGFPGDLRVLRASGWRDLRVIWDLDVRREVSGATTLVVVSSGDFREPVDLPWEVEQEAAGVLVLRAMVPPSLIPLFRAWPEMQETLVEAAQRGQDTAEVLRGALGIRAGDPRSELEAIARLRTTGAPAELWPVLASVLSHPLLRTIASDGGELGPLQGAWDRWLLGGGSVPDAPLFESSGAVFLELLGHGLIKPAPLRAVGLPGWVRVGAAEADPGELLATHLESRPANPSTIEEWVEAALWWGTVRATLAAQPNVMAREDAAWEAWTELDVRFRGWLRSDYGSTLLSSSALPRALHQVAPFLARSVEDGARVLLVVLDGMGFAQWIRLRSLLPLRVVDATGLLAMLPTLTSVSRQSLLSGKLPREFPESITRTASEPHRWARFWRERGMADGDVAYHRVVGSDPGQVPELRGRAVTVVVTAIDQLLHGADVLGDRQVSAGLDLWARAGFLEALVRTGAAGGYDVWITSDHGNLPTEPGPVPREGQTVETAGMRVRLYPNPILRERASEFGDAWDPPGYPEGALRPLFALGRRGFHSSGTRVTHGGLAMDEVLVPFARVTP